MVRRGIDIKDLPIEVLHSAEKLCEGHLEACQRRAIVPPEEIANVRSELEKIRVELRRRAERGPHGRAAKCPATYTWPVSREPIQCDLRTHGGPHEGTDVHGVRWAWEPGAIWEAAKGHPASRPRS